MLKNKFPYDSQSPNNFFYGSEKKADEQTTKLLEYKNEREKKIKKLWDELQERLPPTRKATIYGNETYIKDAKYDSDSQTKYVIKHKEEKAQTIRISKTGELTLVPQDVPAEDKLLEVLEETLGLNSSYESLSLKK